MLKSRNHLPSTVSDAARFRPSTKLSERSYIYIYISTYVFLSFNIEQFPPILALPQDLRLSLILALYLAVTATGAVALRLRGAAPALLLGLGLIVAPWRIRYERCGFSGASGWGEAATRVY